MDLGYGLPCLRSTSKRVRCFFARRAVRTRTHNASGSSHRLPATPDLFFEEKRGSPRLLGHPCHARREPNTTPDVRRSGRIRHVLGSELGNNAISASVESMVERLGNSVPFPGIDDSTLTVETLTRHLQDGINLWTAGDHEEAAKNLKVTLAEVAMNPAIVAADPTLRTLVQRAYIARAVIPPSWSIWSFRTPARFLTHDAHLRDRRKVSPKLRTPKIRTRRRRAPARSERRSSAATEASIRPLGNCAFGIPMQCDTGCFGPRRGD